METITLTLCDNRTGMASGYLGGLTKEAYRFEGRDVPDGAKVALLTPDGRTLAAATVQGGAAEVDTDTQEVADLLRYQPVGAEAQVHIAIGDSDNILAIIPAKMRKNWLDDSAVHPPAPLPDYWTAKQTREAIDEALKGYATQAWVGGRLEDYLPLTGGTVTGKTTIMGTTFQNKGWIFTAELSEGGKWLKDKYAFKAHTHAQSDVTGLTAALAAKQDALIPGEGIDLCGNVISATGGGGLPNTILISSGNPATVDAEAQKYVVIGAGASGSRCSVVVGDGGFANESGVALGEGASADVMGVAIGRGAGSYTNGVAIGSAHANGSAVAIGKDVYAFGNALALGASVNAREFSVALGASAGADGVYSVALGAHATTCAEGVAVGLSATVTGSGGVANGAYAKAFEHSVALGYCARGGSGWYEGKAIAIGYYSEAFDDSIAIGVGAVVCSTGHGNLALGSCAFVGYDADFENAAIGYGAVVDGVCTYRAAVLGAQGYTNISGGTVLSASDREQTLTLQLYLVACRELCKYGVIGLTMTDWLTGETCGVYTGADVFMAALNGTPWTGAFGGCCSCAA